MIRYWNPYTEKEEVEQVYGDRLIQFLYDTGPGQKATEILAWPLLSKVYGLYQASPLSQRKIGGFIETFNIKMEDYESGPFASFNDFFIRKFVEGRRPFRTTPTEMPAFAEGRYLGYERLSENHRFPVKGKYLRAADLLGNTDKSIPFREGPILIARLCPTDYHRFHYPDDGETQESWRLAGPLHSVNPLALQFKNDIFVTNERVVTLFKTKNFGRLAFIEVGALCVGRIVQSHTEKRFKRGEEKGYFLFGGSTVIVLGETGRWTPRSDIVKRSAAGQETFLRLGDVAALSSELVKKL